MPGVSVSDLKRENKTLRKKSQEETIAELRQEIEELNEQLDNVYGFLNLLLCLSFHKITYVIC
mgnify:CR=1 FL=1